MSSLALERLSALGQAHDEAVEAFGRLPAAWASRGLRGSAVVPLEWLPNLGCPEDSTK